MKLRIVLALGILIAGSLFAGVGGAEAAEAAGEYSKHFGTLSKLSIAVAQAMPAEKYRFRPHPESMTFEELMPHIATTNYQFCAGLKDSKPPVLPTPTEKDETSDSFAYCGTVIPSLTEQQISKAHNSPDGRLSRREVLLAMYVHVAHHRGQAEIYLRVNGIRPPNYMV